MFFIVLLFMVLLGLFMLILVVQNFETLVYNPVHLKVLMWQLPGAPIVLLCALCAFLSALLLYFSVVRSAHRDKKEIKSLRARIEELEKAPAKSPSGGLIANFAPQVVPMPGYASGGAASGPSGSGNLPGPAGSPGSTGPGPRQASSGSLSNLSPSASGNNLSLPPRPFPQQQQQQQMGGPRPPFPHS